MIENEMTVSVPLEVVKASEIEPKEVKWLWYPYIPVGKVTLLQGDPGDGKSKLMLSIAALLSKGEPLPFTETEENEPMTIIYQFLFEVFHGAELLQIQQLTFEQPEKIFYHSIVQTVSLAAHALANTFLPEHL